MDNVNDRIGATGGEESPVIEPDNALPEVALESLPEPLRLAAARAGWTSLMPVQAKTFGYILAGCDLMVQSRTGSGKTGAYALPILARVDPRRATCQALVLVPTRELAQQVAKEAELLGSDMGIRVVAVYGGVSYGPQLEAFRQGGHLVVGTPGRILDHLLRGSLSLQDLRILVFDEADRMLSMGFYPDMQRVQEYLPKRSVDSYMFSATIPTYVQRLAEQFLHQPEFLSLSKDHVHVTNTRHVYYDVPGMDKDRCLVRIIEVENPPSALIFCNTKARVHYVTVVLQRFGYNADELSSDPSQAERTRVMTRLRSGTLRFLVATDVAARGIDIPDLSHVILYEVPEDVEGYIHRAGRTGRAGATGEAISLVSSAERGALRRISQHYDIELLERPVPSEEDLGATVSQRLLALLEAKLRDRDRLQIERMQRFLPLARSLAESDEELALVAMMLDDYYHQAVHASRVALPGEPTREKQAPTKERPSRRRREPSRGRRRRRS